MIASRRSLIAAVLALGTSLAMGRAAEAATGEVTENPFRNSQMASSGSQSVLVETIERPPAVADAEGSMQQMSVDIALPAGKLPTGVTSTTSSTMFAGDMPRPWPAIVYHWQAAATRHQPLYFEETNAERYGYSCNWVWQPFVSTAHFFGTIPALPYLKASNCPWECQYTLGHYRAGSCPPYRRHCWPVDARGAVAELGTATWLVFVLP